MAEEMFGLGSSPLDDLLASLTGASIVPDECCIDWLVDNGQDVRLPCDLVEDDEVARAISDGKWESYLSQFELVLSCVKCKMPSKLALLADAMKVAYTLGRRDAASIELGKITKVAGD